MSIIRIKVSSTDELLRIFGPQDKNLKYLEKEFNVRFYIENGYIMIKGNKSDLNLVNDYILNLQNGKIRELEDELKEKNNQFILNIKGIKPKTVNQKKFLEKFEKHEIMISIGPAGTGKTFLAVLSAINYLNSGKVKKIVITRPVVEAGEKLGFLPGDLYEKINPYMKPIEDAFFFILGPSKYKRMKEDSIIEIIPLAYMRGRTLSNSFIVLDEAQNSTIKQMKMFLTRLGFGSKMIITGDITQIDLDRKEDSGLIFIEKNLKNIPGIEFFYFSSQDTLRHPILKKIIDVYERKGIY